MEQYEIFIHNVNVSWIGNRKYRPHYDTIDHINDTSASMMCVWFPDIVWYENRWFAQAVSWPRRLGLSKPRVRLSVCLCVGGCYPCLYSQVLFKNAKIANFPIYSYGCAWRKWMNNTFLNIYYMPCKKECVWVIQHPILPLSLTYLFPC